LTVRASTTVAVRRVVTGKLAVIEQAAGGSALVLGAEQALIRPVVAVGHGVAETVNWDALGLVKQSVTLEAGILALPARHTALRLV
jgi:hypothetical protein